MGGVAGGGAAWRMRINPLRGWMERNQNGFWKELQSPGTFAVLTCLAVPEASPYINAKLCRVE